ncbi:hypothetical protein [Streptomyces sp. CT34]|uniref:hypothetical protein n=1 Tax=Streptomyces sp. CT34 TaxID=1553907 RepID=UPI0005BB738B|nr:hypothetical protein [Streptomyces sp. CT34]
MTLTLSVVLLAGIGVLVLLRLKSATLTAVIVAALFGFYLAGTGAAHTANELVTSLAHALHGIN